MRHDRVCASSTQKQEYSLLKILLHQEQKSKFKSKLNGRARRQMRWGIVWPWSKPKPETKNKYYWDFPIRNRKTKAKSLSWHQSITLSLSGNLSFLGGPLLLPSHTSCSSPSEVKMLQKKSQPKKSERTYVMLKAPRRGFVGLVSVSTPGKEVTK